MTARKSRQFLIGSKSLKRSSDLCVLMYEKKTAPVCSAGKEILLQQDK